MKGIDVSQWQGVIDWAAVKNAGVEFVYVKAGEGIGIIDPRHKANFTGAKAVGLAVGWYYFGHPSQNVTQAAQFLVNLIKPIGYGDLPIILDIELTENVSDVDAWATAFLDEVARLTGHPVGWYSSSWFASTYLTNTMKKYPFGWVAQYSSVAPAIKWMIWQQSQDGHIPGISTPVDIDEGVSSLLGTIPQYVMFDVVVNNHVYPALVYGNDTYVLWTALNEFKTTHVYKGNGVFDINGEEVKGIVYKNNTYVPWFKLAPGIKPYKVNWAFEV